MSLKPEPQPEKLYRAHIEATFRIPASLDALEEIEKWVDDLFCETWQVVEIIEESEESEESL